LSRKHKKPLIRKRTIVFGTVHRDMHNIGKMSAEAEGFEVTISM
jgi:methanogenic corrinoid protein MtbC1